MLNADLILVNAKVLTMEPVMPLAEAVATRGERIIFVGSNEDVGQFKGPKTSVMNCQQKTVLPGFIDAHCHIFSLIRQLSSMDLSPRSGIRSIKDINSVIRERAQKTPLGKWLNGTGYNDFYLAEKRHPTRWDLDEAAPEHPVLLAHRSLHACVLNSKALKLAGITIESEAPPGGLIERDLATGEPNGLLYDMLGYIRSKVMPPLSESEIDEGLKISSRHLLKLGITSVQDATVTNNLEQWRSFHRSRSKFACRLCMMAGADFVDEFLREGMKTGYGDDRLRLGAVKIVLSKATGRLQPSQRELDGLVQDLHQSGYQIAVHAIEQDMIESAVTAFESIYQPPKSPSPLPSKGQGTSLWGRRHRIEHCSVCQPELVSKIRKLGIIVVSQPPFVYYSGERYLSEVPEDQRSYLYSFKSLLDAEIVLAGSSDVPVVSANPLIGLYAAITRKAETGQHVALREAVSLEQALAMYTVNAAKASFEEEIKGSISIGRLADFVVLSHDLQTAAAEPESIKEINVERTILGGKVVYGRQ